MRSATWLGKLGLGAGVVAIGLMHAARHSQSLRASTQGVLLGWVDRLGWVQPPGPGLFMVIEPPGWLSFTDATGLKALLTLGSALATVAMLPAVMSDQRREMSPFAGAAFMCGACAWSVHEFAAGFIALAAGAVAVIGVRALRRPTRPVHRRLQPGPHPHHPTRQ